MAGERKAEGERKVEPELAADQAARAFAARLVELMDTGTRANGRNRRWSTEELGDECGVSARTVRNWRNGTYLPDIETLVRLFFGIDPKHDEARAAFRALWASARRRTPKVEPEARDAGAAQDKAPAAEPIRPPTRCFGRDEEAAPLITVLASPAPAALLVLGAAGMGKTTLTRHVATATPVIARFGPRRWFVPLETVTDAASLPAAVIQGIGLDPANTTLQVALSYLAETPALLVLDNLETPWERDRPAVQDVVQTIAATQNVSILASLRGRAAPPAPRWSLPPAPLPQLPEQAAGSLFLDLAPSAAAHPAHLDRFLTALGGIPLAVELVALRAAGDTPLPELWAEWQRRGSALAADPDLPPDRLTSLHRSLDLSWNSPRLRQEGKLLLRLLGQLPAGIAEPDRTALIPDDGTEAARQLRVTGLAHNQGDRLDLLPPIRDYASLLHPPEPADAVACARYYLSLAMEHGARVGAEGGNDAVIRLGPELPNVEASVHVVIGSGDLSPAISAAYGLTQIIRFSGLGSANTIDALRQACHATEGAAAEANCIRSLGDIALARSDHDAARARYEEALPLYRRVGAVLGEANCIGSLGDIALARSDHDAARARYEEALPMYRRVGAVLGEANCIRSLGDIALARSDHDAARARYEEALPLYRRVGDVLGEANCIRNLGDIALARSDHDAARARYEEALPMYRRVGDVLGEANCIRSLGDIALARSDHDAARARYEEALPLYSRVGDVLGEANCIRNLGDIALARSDHDAARARYEEALPMYRRVGDVLGEANCIRSLGDIALARSDHDAARARYEEALPLYSRVGDVLGEANCIRNLGDIALARSDHDAARARYEEALPLYRRVGAVLGEANCIRSLGDIALARSDHDAARARYEEALPLYSRVGAVLGEANCIRSLGDIALARSDHDAARARYEEALPMYRRVGDVLGEANCIGSLGDIALARSDHDAARARYEEALPMYRRVGDVLGEANCIGSLGDIALARSDHDAARARYEEALPMYRRVGDVLGEAICFAMLGQLARAVNDQDTARTHFAAALSSFRRIGARQNEALALEDLASVATGAERDGHLRPAREIWLALDRPDRVAQLDAG